VDDVQRYRRLQEQEARDFVAPESVADLMVMGDIPGAWFDKALARWEDWRDALAQGAPVGAQDRFLFLTYALAQATPGRPGGAALRARILGEATSLLTVPSLRDQVLALRARDHIREGHLSVAEALLRPCEPISDDLFADSDVRTSRALLAIARKDPRAALELTGHEPGDLPVARTNRPLLDVLRAAAYDDLGDDTRADAHLRRALVQHGLRFVEAARERYADLDLCGGALTRIAAEPAPPSVGATTGVSLLPLTPAVVPFLIGVGSWVAAVFVDPEALTDDGFSLPSFLFLFGLGWLAIGAFVVWTLRHAMPPSPAELREGVTAAARVTRVREIGLEILGVPQLEMDLEVFLGDDPPFRATARVGVMEIDFPKVTALREVPVLIDPHDRARVQVLLQRTS
jgi:hypothetical protein